METQRRIYEVCADNSARGRRRDGRTRECRLHFCVCVFLDFPSFLHGLRTSRESYGCGLHLPLFTRVSMIRHHIHRTTRTARARAHTTEQHIMAQFTFRIGGSGESAEVNALLRADFEPVAWLQGALADERGVKATSSQIESDLNLVNQELGSAVSKEYNTMLTNVHSTRALESKLSRSNDRVETLAQAVQRIQNQCAQPYSKLSAARDPQTDAGLFRAVEAGAARCCVVQAHAREYVAHLDRKHRSPTFHPIVLVGHAGRCQGQASQEALCRCTTEG